MGKSTIKFKGANEAQLTYKRLIRDLSYDAKIGRFVAHRDTQWLRCGTIVGYRDITGYRRVSIDGKRYLEHRLVWFYVHKRWPKNTIDHIDMDKGNNKIENLREATASQNHRNMKPMKSMSGLKGAVWNRFRGYYQSYIKFEGKSRFLGRFDTAEEAHDAYKKAALAYGDGFVRFK